MMLCKRRVMLFINLAPLFIYSESVLFAHACKRLCIYKEFEMFTEPSISPVAYISDKELVFYCRSFFFCSFHVSSCRYLRNFHCVFNDCELQNAVNHKTEFYFQNVAVEMGPSSAFINRPKTYKIQSRNHHSQVPDTILFFAFVIIIFSLILLLISRRLNFNPHLTIFVQISRERKNLYFVWDIHLKLKQK